MNKIIKISILLIILLIPALIYIFLRTFGQNEFSLPVYHNEGTLQTNVQDGEESLIPKNIYFSGLLDAKGQPIDLEFLSGKIIVMELITQDEDLNIQNHHIYRISDVFKDEQFVHFLRIFDSKYSLKIQNEEELNGRRNNVSVCFQRSEIMESIVGLPAVFDKNEGQENISEHIMLLDSQKRVRGFYKSHNFEEMDRLILEIKILLKQNQNV